MPAKTEKQRMFKGTELQRKREGKKTQTDEREAARGLRDQGRRQEEEGLTGSPSRRVRQGPTPRSITLRRRIPSQFSR